MCVVHTIGPYSFTTDDARRTVANHEPIWGLFHDGRDASVLSDLEPTLTGDLDADLRAVWAAWTAAGPALRAAGQLPSMTTGQVIGLHRSDGGVPKEAVDEVDVDWRGVVGDRQKSRIHHGRPWQALCIWNIESIEALRAAGHPIGPGFAGENVTVAGLPWDQVRAGVRLQLGTVVCDVSAFALPCKNNAKWFADGDSRWMWHERGMPSRVYATVVQRGRIAVGDAAILEPDWTGHLPTAETSAS